MSIWSLLAQSDSELDTIPSPPPESAAPPVPVSMWAKLQCDSIRPFEAETIGALRTHRGIVHGAQRQQGLYSITDESALAELRQRKADKFLAMLWADGAANDFFTETFSEREWADSPAQSGTRLTGTKPQFNTMQRVG